MTHPVRLIPGVLLLFALSTPASGDTPSHYWSQRYGGTGVDGTCEVVVDASGNAYVTGYFNGTVNFGGSNLTSAGSEDIFIASYNSSGTHRWSRRAGSTLSDAALDIAVDASGNVVVTGHFSGTVNFGGANLTSAGGWDVFIARYNSAGTHQWSQRFGGTSDEIGYGIDCDAAGNVAITGWFYGTTNLGGANLVSAGDSDAFLAKYDPAGTHLWSQRFGSTGADDAMALDFDPSGNVLATGEFWGTVNFGGGNLVSAGNWDIFLAKYNSAGVHTWSQRLGLSGYEYGFRVRTDASGNIYLAGGFSGTTNLGGANLSGFGSDDIFLAKYTSAGTHQWSKSFGSAISDRIYGLAVDASGRPLITGHFGLTMSLGGGALVSAGDLDVFVAGFAADGAHEFSHRMGGIGADMGRGVAVAPGGSWLLTGYFGNTVNFGGSPLTSTGSDDIFLATYGQESAEPDILSITDIGNDQGRRVKIRFRRTGFDFATSPNWINYYEVYRRDDPAPSAPGAEGRTGRTVLDDNWTLVGSVTAHTKDTYGIDVPTIGDSTVADGQYYSVFFVRAATALPGTFYDSPPDSGWSLDNLAPGVPGGLAFTAGVLSWNGSKAGDFSHFTVYGAGQPCFCSAIVVGDCTDGRMDVGASPYPYYFVTATDRAGNEGKPARIDAANGATGPPESYTLSLTNYPNPFNPSTAVNYTVPSRGIVTVAIHDLRGARLAVLVDHETREPGAYTARWDGRTERGAPVASGVYFARIEHNGVSRTRKMMLLK